MRAAHLPPPACPDWMRRSHASATDAKLPSAAGISRVRLGAELMARRAAARLDAAEATAAWFCMLGRCRCPSGPCRGTRCLPGPAAASTSSRRDSTRAAARGFGAGDRGQVERACPASRVDLRRIDQPVAAHPHVVARLRQIGDDVAAAIVGDDDPDEPRRQVAASRRSPRRRPRARSAPVTTPPMSSASRRTDCAGAGVARSDTMAATTVARESERCSVIGSCRSRETDRRAPHGARRPPR